MANPLATLIGEFGHLGHRLEVSGASFCATDQGGQGGQGGQDFRPRWPTPWPFCLLPTKYLIYIDNIEVSRSKVAKVAKKPGPPSNIGELHAFLWETPFPANDTHTVVHLLGENA
jgi:hypothetical protein